VRFENLSFFLMRWGVHDNSLAGTMKKARRSRLASKRRKLMCTALRLYARKQPIMLTGFSINFLHGELGGRPHSPNVDRPTGRGLG
jgi:hypothetical protein